MTNLLNLDRNSLDRDLDLSTERYASQAPKVAPAPEAPPAELRALEETAEFEIVLGRRQIASTSLVVIVLAAMLSAFSYLIGKSMASNVVAATPMVQSAPIVQQVPVTVVQTNAQKSSPPLPQATVTAASSVVSAPIVGEELAGKVYIQVGAGPKGVGAIWAEGLRTHGLDAFVAPGPNNDAWRVVVGPLPDPQAFERAKRTLDAIGVETFGRRHEAQSSGVADVPHPQ